MPQAFKTVVVGGGPAGSFFALQFLKQAKHLGRKAEILIIEKKINVKSQETPSLFFCQEGCNYCAGGISPRMAQALEKDGLELPEEIIAERVKSLIINGHWKNIELKVPDYKRMYSVFRGSRPKGKVNKYINFDSFILETAREAGARIISGVVYDVRKLKEGKLEVYYRTDLGRRKVEKSIQANFIVFAGGVNQTLGKPFEKQPLVKIIQRIIPRYRPPKVRKAFIIEVGMEKHFEEILEGEIYFVEYGSKDLKIDMSSLLPKNKYITIVLLGGSIDNVKSSDTLDIMKEYLHLPQIQRILPLRVDRTFVCACNPNMTIGAAKNIIGDRAVVIGDLAVSRLYKDGLYSSYLQASSLARIFLDDGPSYDVLKRKFWPTVKKIKHDNIFGTVIFILNRVFYSNPTLSRILYQAVLTERKTKPSRSRRLEKILWKIASGDGTYQASFISMFHPLTIFSILVGGFLVTIRNYLTELIFGLRWKDLGRYPTGLHKENFEERKREFFQVFSINPTLENPEFESMYSITIKSSRDNIFRLLGKFGDDDRKYFKPRIIRVKRTSGSPNRKGCVLQYQTPFKFLDFSLILKDVIDHEYLLYTIKEGFAKDGILLFHIKGISAHVSILSIYVSFNFAKEKKLLERMAGNLLRYFFPWYIHDVLWNHSLCELKNIIETELSLFS